MFRKFTTFLVLAITPALVLSCSPATEDKELGGSIHQHKTEFKAEKPKDLGYTVKIYVNFLSQEYRSFKKNLEETTSSQDGSILVSFKNELVSVPYKYHDARNRHYKRVKFPEIQIWKNGTFISSLQGTQSESRIKQEIRSTIYSYENQSYRLKKGNKKDRQLRACLDLEKVYADMQKPGTKLIVNITDIRGLEDTRKKRIDPYLRNSYLNHYKSERVTEITDKIQQDGCRSIKFGESGKFKITESSLKELKLLQRGKKRWKDKRLTITLIDENKARFYLNNYTNFLSKGSKFRTEIKRSCTYKRRYSKYRKYKYSTKLQKTFVYNWNAFKAPTPEPITKHFRDFIEQSNSKDQSTIKRCR